jgi:two-component system, chemotaxis family, chemotaxis protein CheY
MLELKLDDNLLADYVAESQEQLATVEADLLTIAKEKMQISDRCLRVLLVEDDFACRLLLQTFLSRYGECHIAVNGREALHAFQSALDRDQRYDLICMDIMMPEMDGREAVHRIRAMEEAREIGCTASVRIFMTTTIDDLKEVISCFKELCDEYLVKPIDLVQLLDHMESHQLVPQPRPLTTTIPPLSNA